MLTRLDVFRHYIDAFAQQDRFAGRGGDRFARKMEELYPFVRR